jgi:putative transposase
MSLRYEGKPITEIPTDEGKLYFASVLDLHSRRLLASATSDHPDADLACDAIKMAAAVRGGRAAIDGVIFHTDYAGSGLIPIADLPTRQGFSPRCAERSGCRSRWAGSVSITPPRRRSSRPSNTRSCPGTTSPRKPTHARLWWPGALTSTTAGHRHSSAALMSPIQYERLAADQPAAA